MCNIFYNVYIVMPAKIIQFLESSKNLQVGKHNLAVLTW